MTRRSFPLPSLTALRSFECAARHESFTLAAEELHLTQSAVSRQIRELELTIGVDLFRRIGRRVTMTDAGRALAAEVTVDLDRLRQTLLQTVAVGGAGSCLRVATLPTFGTRWLIPRLPDFEQQHPGIEVHLATRITPFDLARERFDLAIHHGAEDWPEGALDRLCDETVIAVATPALCAAHGLSSAQALRQAPLLHIESRPTAWHDWFAAAGIEVTGILPGKRFDQFSMIIAATRASLGVGLLPEYLIEAELAAGDLVAIGETAARTANAYYIVTPKGVDNPHAALLAAWMHRHVDEHRPRLAIGDPARAKATAAGSEAASQGRR